MDRYAVCVIRNEKPVTDAEHVEFSRRLGPLLPMKMLTMVGKSKSRFAHPEIIDIGNIDAEGRLLPEDDRRRALATRQPAMAHRCVLRPGARRHSLLSCHSIPPGGADTEFADMRAAYDSLSEKRKKEIEPLVVEHSIWYSRALAGDRRERRREGDAAACTPSPGAHSSGLGAQGAVSRRMLPASSGCRWRRAVPCCAS